MIALLASLLSPVMAIAKAEPDVFVPPVNNPNGSRDGWIVRQRGYQFGGCVWYITDQQIKMSGSFLCMIINRKTKRITLYSLKSNRYRNYGLHECAKRVGIYRARQRYVFGPAKVVGKGDYLGQPSTIMLRIGHRITDAKTRQDVEFRDDIIASSKIKFDADISEVLESVLYSVYSNGMPFKVTRTGYIKGKESRSKQSVILSEVHFVKARAIPDTEFAVPKGLKQSQSEMDLLSSDVEVNHI